MNITPNKQDKIARPESVYTLNSGEVNQIVAELMHIILSANITPNQDNNTQILSALNILFNKALFIGAIIPIAQTTVPPDWLICDGSQISRTDYADLFQVIGTTYGVGDGSATFNLPNFIGRTFWGGNTSGRYISAGIPNHWHMWGYNNANNSGSFCATDDGGFTLDQPVYPGKSFGTRGWNGSGGGGGYNGATSSYGGNMSTTVGHPSLGTNGTGAEGHVYGVMGASNSVQPPALETLVCIKYR